MNPLLSSHVIASLCSGAACRLVIEVVDQTGSTNSDLLQRVGSLDEPVLLIAENQTGGRGRAGRIWHSAPGASLTFSLAWPFERALHELAGLTLAASMALVRALKDFGVRAELKWPNDVLKEGSKLAGVLIETATNADKVWAVIGVGLNLALPDELETRIGQQVADARWLAQLDRNTLMAGLLDQLVAMLQTFDAQGFESLRGEWNSLHAYAGKQVMVVDQGRVLHDGLAVGVDAHGRLLLETVSGRIAIASGDVSLRAKE